MRYVKGLLIALVGLPLLALALLWASYHLYAKADYGPTTSTLALRDGMYCWGLACRKQPETLEAFVPLFADQMKLAYGSLPTVWPGLDFSDHVVFLITPAKDRAWRVTTDGEYRSVRPEDVPGHQKVEGFDGEFHFLDLPEKGIVLTVSEAEMSSQKQYEMVLHLGTYDPVDTAVHESFHHFVQDDGRAFALPVVGQPRTERLDNTGARQYRQGIIYFLGEALQARPAKREAYIAAAADLYRKYRDEFPDDHRVTAFYDRIEGLARYVEVMAALSWRQPGADLRDKLAMLRSLQSFEEPGSAIGAVVEGYELGALAGYVLDQTEADPTSWKKVVAGDAGISPVSYLLDRRQPVALPLPGAYVLAIRDKLASIPTFHPKPVIKMLYDIVFGA